MRIITRRRVKVRVTVKRGDGSVTSNGWEYHRKREEEEEHRKQAERDAGGRVTTPDGGRKSDGPPRPSSPPTICVSPYGPVHDGSDVEKGGVEDMDYADASKSSAYESVDGIYEDVRKKGYRVRFGEEEQAEENGNLYSTGAIPKRSSSSTLIAMEEEEEEKKTSGRIPKADINGGSEEDNLYEPVGETLHVTHDNTTIKREGSQDGTRKIEVILSSSRDEDEKGDWEETQTTNKRERSKSRTRGKVEVKFSPWQTGESKDESLAEAFSKGGRDVRVEQNTELSFSDREPIGQGKTQPRITEDESSECPYEVHHRSNIQVSAEDLSDGESKRGGANTSSEEEVVGKKRGSSSRWKLSGGKYEEEFSDEEEKTYSRGRPRMKKRMVVRVDGRGHPDAPHNLLKTFCRTVVTFGRESGGSVEKVQDSFTDGRSNDYDKSEDSDSSIIFLETYGVDPQLLRNDDAEEYDESEANQGTCPESNTSPTHSLTEFGLELDSESRHSVGSDEGTFTDHSSQTDTSTDTLILDGPLTQADIPDYIPDSSECPLGLDGNTQVDINPTDTLGTSEEQFAKRATLTEKGEIQGSSSGYPNDLNDFDSFLQKQSDEDRSSGTGSFFSNFEEKLEQVERQFPNLQVEHLLAEEEEFEEESNSSSLWVCERTEAATLETSEGEKDQDSLLKSFQATKLETNMGQYYSSVSGAEASKGGDVSGSLPSSPRSSEGWRISMASTATVGSSATAGSDDTVAKDMSELSSVNSRLSDLDENQSGGKIPPSAPTAPDPNTTPKVAPVAERKKQTSIKDAIDELESIEQAAQTLLLKRQCSSEEERLTPVPGKDSPIHVSSSYSILTVDKTSPQGKRKVTPSPPPPPGFGDPTEGDAISDKLEKSLSSLESSLQDVDKQILDNHSPVVANGSSSPKVLRADKIGDVKSGVKPPLPPIATPTTVIQQPKMDVKRRLLSRSKEVQLYISRESYNEERVLRELEKLRRSFQESDLNDFLDALDNTAIEDDIEEAFLTQLLEDLREDIEALPDGPSDNAQQKVDDVVIMTESSSEVSSDEATREVLGSPSASTKLEKVREKISERIRKRKESKSSDSGSSEASGTPKDEKHSESSKVDSNQLDTPLSDQLATAQSDKSDTSDTSSQVQILDVAKTEDTKKGFNITQFLKKGSPKYLRKKYKERKNRKSDLITTSESESEDPESCKKEPNGSVLKSQSSLKGSNRSLNGTQDTKKEVRFDLDSDARVKELDSYSSGRATSANIVRQSEQKSVPGPILVTCEARRQETVVLKESEEREQETPAQQPSLQPPQQACSPLPAVVEDINSRAESILPKLPERVKPPRRKKMIPTPVEELSRSQPDASSASKAVKATDARTEFLKNMTAEKDESPPPLSHYEINLNASKSPSVAVVENKELLEATESRPILATQNESLQPLEKSVVTVPDASSVSAPLQSPSSIITSQEVVSCSSSQKDALMTTAAPSQLIMSDQIVSSREETLVAPIPVTSVAPISIALPEATKIVCPPRTLPLPVIEECAHEDQTSLPTPSEPTTVSSSSYGDTTPGTPPFEVDKFPSLYDNVNPFKEMLEQEKIMEVRASTEPTHPPEIRTEVATETTRPGSVTPTNKLEDLSLPQAARKSPEPEKLEVVDIDALAALTAEMFKFAEEMEKEVPKKSTRPPFRGKSNAGRRDADTYVSPRRVETKEVGTEPETSQHSILKKRGKSNTIGIQTDNARSVRTYEAASQTDTEYETETESEMEDIQQKKYDASKWTFGPVREQTLPLPSAGEPQLGHLHQQQQRLIQELQKKTVMHQQKEKAKPKVPPRNYQDKMPLKVVAELKNVLSDLEDYKPTPSRIVEQPPRWDSQLTWPHARYGGYMSEPEGYDSDIGGGTLRYATVDRRRGPQYEADPMTSSLPRECLIDLDPYDRNTSRYVHQPGRIEDYVPGYSSLAEKELKRSQSQEPPPVSVNHRFGSQMMSMTHALKESGYESDSTLVFKKREDARRLAPDPRKTSQVYRQIQRGGDIPITGLQKPNPPKPKEEYYVVYSDLDLGLHHPSLSDLFLTYGQTRIMAPPTKPPMHTFGDKKRSAPSKVVVAPSPPRRISSKWHPSLMKASKDRPPVPSARSTSAERVRETRALYSTWHREKVARSREKLGSSNTKTTSLGRSLSAAKQTQEVRENFLKGRRTVSESRFTIEDRENSPPRRTAPPAKTKSPLRHYESRDKLHYRSSQRDILVDRSLPIRQLDHAASHVPGHTRSLSADTSRKWSSASADSGRSVMRHTVSSMNKIKRTSLQQNHSDGPCQASRSSSADSTCRRRRSSCLSPESQPASRKSPVSRKDSRPRGSPYSDISMEAPDDKKLKQSESFDTTQSNETGYSSMIDLSPSPTPEKKIVVEESEKRPRKKSEPPSPRSQSSPVRRSRFSASFTEQRNKWEAITRGDAVGGRLSRSTSRSTSPLRSLQLVRQVSSSFKDIPTEVSLSSPVPRRSRSLDVLTPSPHSHPRRYRQYILELRNAAPRNARISQLRRLFTSLERVHRLERSVSSVELSVAESRSQAIIDFETWKGLREKERKALEYNVLLKELNVAQREKEFLYKVTPEKKWAGDCRLRGRDAHVTDLRDKFSTISDNTSEVTYKRRRELENSKDTYRGLWRGSSVRDLSHMYQDPERRRSSKRGSSLSLSREDSGLRSRGLWTSLSLEQVNAFRDHLAEIYGSMQSIRSWRERKQRNQGKGQHRAQQELSNHKVDVAETGRALADKLRTLHSRTPSEPSKRSPARQPSPTRATKSTSSLTNVEDQRRQLSKQLSIEFQEKVMEQKSSQGVASAPATLDTLPVPDVSLSISPESLSRSSPRTCYSLDISDSSEPNSLNSDQLLLVVQKPGRSGRSQSLPPDPEPASDPESSDSEVSVRTVVHKDVAGKVKFFEKRARRNSRSSERHSSRGSQLNVDEVPHYATLPSRLKQQSQSKLLSQNYLPERSVSSVNLNSKADVASQVWRMYDKTNPVSGSSMQRLVETSMEPRDQRNPTSHSRSYLYNVKTGDVNRLKLRFESPEDARRRTRSLPNVNGPLSRVTPTGRTIVRGQEAGDVQFMKARYETPRRSRSPERWQPIRDEYLPKSKLTSTMQTLATRSPSFREPDTIERLARKDSVEKAVLRRVHTGNVEASVDRLERKRQERGSGLSIIGQMYTSTPSMKELANMAPLVPPRPPPPLMGPQKPQRMSRSNPQPLLTSTPTPSPIDVRAAHKQRALSVQEPVCPPPIMVHPPPGSSATFSSQSGLYNADAHRPKARYTPQESYGGGPSSRPSRYGGPNWTQSLERPQRVTRAMTHSAPPPPTPDSHYHHAGRHLHQTRKTSPADYHTYSQPYSHMTHTYAQPSRQRQSYPHHSHSPGREQSCGSKAVSWKESPYKYESGEVNIHYRTPVRIEQKESIPEEELARRQEEHMKKVYENERRKKYLAELEDIERRRHTDNFTPLQKSPIPLNRYDDESSLGTMRGVRTPDLKQVAKALYNFSAQNKREISFNKGDVVFIRRQIDKNWYEGEHRGSVGIFPCNYVEIVPYDSIRTLTRKPTEGQARARFNFQAQTSMEMSLSKGELVVLTRRVDENWYEGRIGNRKGIFPVSYVDTLMEPGADRPLTPSSSPMPRPALPAANLLYNGASSYSSPYSTLGRPGSQNDSRPYHQSLTVNTQQEPVPYRALYNYKPQNDDELELLENDLVMVMEKCDDGWFVGTSRRTGLFGTFPGNYVEKV
ncbi:uncharacterized protein LOC135100596 isoform X5 [Scylla paramamosain]|uniref:uncharacterized protein LOC135100596 isoform X5 n=1 Tax=Scylla paramamosain TaxID=85552 RepID=UPI0030836711